MKLYKQNDNSDFKILEFKIMKKNITNKKKT